MAEIERFTAQAPARGGIAVPKDTGAADLLATVAQTSAQITRRLGDWADRRRIAEAKEDAAAGASQVEMPGVDFAYAQNSPSTTVSASTRGMRGDVRKVVSDAAQRYGIDPNALLTIAMIESSGNPAAKNPNSSAGGLFQFIDSTARQYGLANRFDPAQAADAAARLARDNASHLRRVLGRDPTGAELYLAHQQGAGGAAKLLANPNASAASIVGADAVRLNGGHAGMTAGEFAGLWLKKAGGSPTSAPADGKLEVKLTGGIGVVPQARAGTLYGDAYNAAALDIHVNRLDTAMRTQMEAVALEHEGDPAGLGAALDALRAGYVSDLPPEAAALIDRSFSAQKLSLTRQAVNKFNQNLESANLAAYEENLATRTASVYRLASNAGLDDAADAAIAGELGALTAQIDASPLTPLQKSRAKADAVSNVLTARVLGGFEQLKDPAERAAYVEKFQQDWRAGDGLSGKVDLATYDKINGELTRQLQADQVAANKRDTTLRNSVKSQIDTLKKGWPVPQATRDVLKSEIAKTGDETLLANLDFLDGLADWQKAHIAARPEVIDAQITALEAKIQQEGASEAALTTLDVMEGLRDQMRKGLSQDPLTWANRAGITAVEPLNFADSANLSASLSERVSDAQAVAQHYGIQPRFFTPAETDALKKMLKASPLAMPSLVSSLSAGLGPATPQALAEISKDAPLLAHVAGLVSATGSQGPAVEIAEALELRNMPTYKSALPSAGKIQSAASEALGTALAVLPGTNAGALEAATALFESRAMARGVDMENFGEPSDPARILFQEALDEVLGASTRDGIKYGGLTDVNGALTVAPPDIAADQLGDMVSSISADDLIFQGAIGTANGVPIRAEQLRTARLVMTQQGRYRLALGDVAGGDPRYVPDGEGGYFELDIGMLQRSQTSRGALANMSAQQRRRRTIEEWGSRLGQ